MKEKHVISEERMTALLGKVVDGIAASDKLKERAIALEVPQKTVVASRRWVYSLATAAVVIVISAVALIPRMGEASALIKVQNAISGVQTMQVQSYVNDKPHQEIYYQNREWLMHTQIGTGHSTWSLVKNDQFFKWEDDSTTATLEPYACPVWILHDGSALDFVKSQLSLNETDLTTKQESHSDINGRPTYKLIIFRSDPVTGKTDERCELIVDSQTNLPLTATTFATVEGGEYRNREEFTFNVTVDDAMFQPCEGHATLIRDLPKERQDLLAAWATPLATATDGSNPREIRNVVVNSDGVVYLAYTGDLPNLSERKTTFAPTTLQDQDDTIYLRLPDYGPGFISSFSDDLTKEMIFGGHKLAFCAWAPLIAKHPSGPLSLTIGFQDRTFSGWTGGATSISGQQVNAHVTANPIANAFPDYSVPLWLRYVDANTPSEITALRTAYTRVHP